jgi:hypothetical protein
MMMMMARLRRAIGSHATIRFHATPKPGNRTFIS